MACEKMWTMINVQAVHQEITTCCARNMDKITLEQLSELGPRIFTDGLASVRRDRNTFLDQDLLPESCAVCKQTWPNSLWHSWNSWRDRDWTDAELADLRRAEMINLIEISLSNTCNQTCMYCGPKNSSDWAKLLGTEVVDNTPWKQALLSALYQFISAHLNTRPGDITYNFLGGEPLLNTELHSVIGTIMDLHAADNYPLRHKQMMITTNLNVKPELVNRLLDLIDSKPGWDWMVKCSLDAVGARGETIRDGLSVERWRQNFQLLLHNPRITLEILPSVSALSIPEMPELICWVLGIVDEQQLLKSYGDRWQFGINVVHRPAALHPGNLTEDYRTSIDQCMVALEPIDDIEHVLKFKTHLTNLRGMIGTLRSPHDQTIMRTWFLEQGRIKQRDYWQLFPMLHDLCGN